MVDSVYIITLYPLLVPDLRQCPLGEVHSLVVSLALRAKLGVMRGLKPTPLAPVLRSRNMILFRLRFTRQEPVGEEEYEDEEDRHLIPIIDVYVGHNKVFRVIWFNALFINFSLAIYVRIN